MRALLDQGLPYSTTGYLKAQGWEVLHTVDLGMERAKDHEIIEYAREHNYVCVTLDSDFHTLIAVANASFPSVIRLRWEGLKGREVADLLLRIYAEIELDLKSGALITVTEKNVRVRQLPIQSPVKQE